MLKDVLIYSIKIPFKPNMIAFYTKKIYNKNEYRLFYMNILK